MKDNALLSPQKAKDPSPAASAPGVIIDSETPPHARTWHHFRRQCLNTHCGYPFCQCFPMLEAE